MVPVPRIDVRPDHWVMVRDILRKHVPQHAVWAFGSRAKWLAKEYSDLDLAVISDRPLGLSVSAALADDFAESDLPWKVDVVDWATTSESFRKVIAGDRVVVQQGYIAAGRVASIGVRAARKSEATGSGRTAGAWQTVALGELTINYDGKRRPVKEADRRPGPYPYYGASGVVDHVDDYLLDGDYLLIAEDGENLRTRQTPIAFMACGRSWVNNHAHIVTGNDRADTQFLMYAIEASDVGAYLTGAVMPKLTQANLNRIPLPCPSIDEQKQIVKVLGPLDDKIELNHRMSQTLEAIAQAIFKSWFVDFEPVLAKSSGESATSIGERLGMTEEVLASFPPDLEKVGEVPAGWRHRPLSELTSYLSRGISPKYVDAGGVVVLNQKCVRDHRVSTRDARRHDPSQRSVQGRELQINDILVNSTGVGTLGRVAQIMTLDEATIVDSHLTVVRADWNKTTANYLGMALYNRQGDIEAMGDGSTGQTELSRARLAAMSVLAPPLEVLIHFDNRTASLRQAVAQLDRQNETLALTRNALLPRLLSGALQVGEEVAA